MIEMNDEENAALWCTPVRDAASVARVLTALKPYAARTALRDPPPPGGEIQHEQSQDRLLECLAQRLHAIFMKTWDPNEVPALEAKELPMLTGNGACIISLANAFQGWPSRRMTAFHENTKAGMVFGNVDLELTACWILRQRLGLTNDKDKLAMLIDPSRMDLLLDALVLPDHAARNQSLEMHTSTLQEGVESPRPGPRF